MVKRYAIYPDRRPGDMLQENEYGGLVHWLDYDALAARLAEAERDADRYRWLREENHAFDWDGFPWPKGFTWDDDVDMCVNLDRAIDIARAADSADEVKP